MNNIIKKRNEEKGSLVYTTVFALCFLLLGFLSAILTGTSNAYAGLNKPPLSPPPELFAVVWSILYIVIGGVNGSVYFFDDSLNSENIKKGLVFAFVGFFLNLLWYPVFFGRGAFVAALVDVIAIFILNIICIIEYKKIKPIYAYLLIPYAVWLAFATYLNFGVIILN